MSRTGPYFTDPDDPPPEQPKPKRPKLDKPLERGTWVKAWIAGYHDLGPKGPPSKRHPFVGTVLHHKVSGVGHIHLDVQSADRKRFYGFCDRIGFEYEVIDEQETA
jgi:hypothetical protein